MHIITQPVIGTYQVEKNNLHNSASELMFLFVLTFKNFTIYNCRNGQYYFKLKNKIKSVVRLGSET